MGSHIPWPRMRAIAVTLALLAMVAIPGGATAREVSPITGLADLGLPELDITVTASGYEGMPESIAAGRYLVTLTVNDDASDFFIGGAGFVQPPAGMSTTEFLEAMKLSAKESFTPDEEALLDAVQFESHYAGGGYALLGGSVQMVVDLRPGEWVAWGEDPLVDWEPVVFEATGDMPSNLPEPTPDVTVSIGEYVIELAEGELASGPQLMRIDNIGAQAHFIEAGTVTVPITEADVDAALGLVELGTPTATEFDIDRHFEDAFRTGIQSPGTTMWLATEIPSGTHLLWCFFPDVGDYMPHAMHGMYEIIDVDI